MSSRIESLHQDCRSARRYHQHPVVGAEHFVVEIDTDDCVGAELLRLRLEFGERHIPRALQFRFIGGRAAADDVADAGEDVFEDVRAEDGLTGNDAKVLRDALSLDAWCGRDQHDVVLLTDTQRVLGTNAWRMSVGSRPGVAPPSVANRYNDAT